MQIGDEPTLYTLFMPRSAFYLLGRVAGAQLRKAKWIWESATGSEADAIQAEQSVGRDMAAIVLDETPRDSDQTTQQLLDEIGGKLTAVVRNRLHRFHMTCVEADRPTAFALPGGFIFVARPLLQLCHRDRDETAFVLGHEMAHVIRRHAIDRLLKQKVMSAAAMVSPGRGALASWIRQVGFWSLERAYSQDEEYEADALGLLLMRAGGFDPAAPIRMLQRLGALDRTPDSLGLGAYLSTHPPIEDRIIRLRRLG
jgi:beta-barrel assembly-enhancing protease